MEQHSPLSFCSSHNTWLPSDCFYPGSLRANESRCRACNNHQRTMRRTQSLVGRLQWNLYQRERRRGGLYPTTAFVQEVLEKYKGRSILSSDNTSPLCIVRYFSDLPLHQHPWNALLITTAEARKGEAKRWHNLPATVHEYMKEKRAEAM